MLNQQRLRGAYCPRATGLLDGYNDIFLERSREVFHKLFLISLYHTVGWHGFREFTIKRSKQPLVLDSYYGLQEDYSDLYNKVRRGFFNFPGFPACILGLILHGYKASQL